MKTRKIVAFLLTFALILGALPLAVFALDEIYTVPAVENLQTKLEETGGSLILDADFSDATLTRNTSSGQNTTWALGYSPTTGSHFSHINLFDQRLGEDNRNVYAEDGGLIFRAHASDVTSQNDDHNNNLDVNVKNGIVGAGFVISLTVAALSEGRLTDIACNVFCNNATTQIKSIFFSITPNNSIKLADNKVVGKLDVGTPTTLTAHVKIVAPNETYEKGAILYDVYKDGVLIAENHRFVSAKDQEKISLVDRGNAAVADPANNTGLSTDYKVTYARLMHTNGKNVPTDENGKALPKDGQDLYALYNTRFYYSDECYETVHGVNPCAFDGDAKYVSAEGHATACACGKVDLTTLEAHDSELGCSVCQGTVANVSMSIKDDLSMKYFAELNEQFVFGKKLTAKFTVDGKTYETDKYVYDEDYLQYIFTCDGIGPHQISMPIDAVIYADGVAVASKTGYSAVNYLEELMPMAMADAKLKQLIFDLMSYGAAAETFKFGEATTPVNGSLASKAVPAKNDNQLYVAGNDNPDLYIYSAGVLFDTVNKLYFKIYSKTGEFTATLGGKTYTAADLENIGGGYYIIYTDAVSVKEYGKTFVLHVKNADVDASVVYSVNTYAAAMQEDEKMGSLALAMFRYGLSAKAYAGDKMVFAKTAFTDTAYNFTSQNQVNYYNGGVDFLIKGGASITTKTDELGTYVEWKKGGADPQFAVLNENENFSKMQSTAATYTFKLRKDADKDFVQTSNITLDSRYKLDGTTGWGTLKIMQTKADGSILTAGGQNVIKVAEDAITEFSMVIDFADSKIIFYDAEGTVLVEEVFVTPAGSGTNDPLVWKTLLTDYMLYFHVSQGGNDPTLLMYGLSIVEGNIFADANS